MKRKKKQSKPMADTTPGFVDNRHITEGNCHLEHATDLLHPVMNEAGLTRDETKGFVRWMAGSLAKGLLEEQLQEKGSDTNKGSRKI